MSVTDVPEPPRPTAGVDWATDDHAVAVVAPDGEQTLRFPVTHDAAGLCTRIDVYKHAGYFDPEQATELKALAYRSKVIHPPAIVRRFVQLFSGAVPVASRST